MREQKTIFEGLYQVDWSIGHIYNHEPSYSIPNAIRNLLSEDEAIREASREFLFGDSAQAYGMIANITPFILQFVLELLSLEETPDREALLKWIASIAHSYRESGRHSSIRAVKNYVAICVLVEQHIPLLLRLLRHSESDIRGRAARVLGKLNDHLPVVAPELIAQFHVETYQSVQVDILEALANLFGIYNLDTFDQRDHYRDFFGELVETHPSYEIRYLAACAGIMVASMFPPPKPDEISSNTSRVLLDEFWRLCDEADDEYYIYREDVLMNIMALPDRSQILEHLLKDDRLSEDDRHIVLRAWIFARFSYSYERSIGPEFEKIEKGYYYLQNFWKSDAHLKEKKFLLEVVEDDRFWQKPTNLFSCFLGLPDSRDELRAFLESDKD